MLRPSPFSRFFANPLFFHQHSRIPRSFSRSSVVFFNFLIFKGLNLRCDRRRPLDSSLTGYFSINIQGSREGFPSLFFPGLALNLPKQVVTCRTSRRLRSCILGLSGAFRSQEPALLSVVYCFPPAVAPTPCIGPRPFTSASRSLHNKLVYDGYPDCQVEKATIRKGMNYPKPRGGADIAFHVGGR